MTDKTPTPAVDGLFTMDADAPRLLGTRCHTCGTYFFPAETNRCRNPGCERTDLREVELSQTGTVWSYTSAGYAPPPPFVAEEPFEPFAIVAVELEKEGLTVLGQAVRGVGAEELATGMQMELVLEELYQDEAHVYLTWKWKPLGGGER